MVKSLQIVCILSALACGATAAEDAAPVEIPVADALLFKAGSWDVSAIGGAYEESFGGNDEVLAYAGLDIEYFPWDSFAVFAEPLGYAIDQKGDDAVAFGLNLGLRWYFWQPCDWAAFYTEGGLGIIEADRRVPAEGTHHNFVEQIGFGAKFRLNENLAFFGGVRYQHLSNANVHGPDRNPGIDAFGGYGGITIAF